MKYMSNFLSLDEFLRRKTEEEAAWNNMRQLALLANAGYRNGFSRRPMLTDMCAKKRVRKYQNGGNALAKTQSHYIGSGKSFDDILQEYTVFASNFTPQQIEVARRLYNREKSKPKITNVPNQFSYLPIGLQPQTSYLHYAPITDETQRETLIKRDAQKKEARRNFLRYIHARENSLNKGLLVKSTNDTLWYPYDSYEGGPKTIYDGLKLNDGEEVTNVVNKQGYLTNEQAKRFLSDAYDTHHNNARRIYNNRAGNNLAWDELNQIEQNKLIDYCFNGPLYQFKNLMDGVKNKDIEKNYKRYRTVKS